MVVVRFISIAFLALVGCTRQSDTERLSRLIDSLSSEISKLRDELSHRDSLRETKLLTPNDTITKAIVRVKSKPPKIIKKDTLLVRQKGNHQKVDTLVYHFADGGISVKVYPWVDGKQLIEIYALKGGVVITLENINLSYHEDAVDEKYLWNRSIKRWEKQEIEIETIQPVTP